MDHEEIPTWQFFHVQSKTWTWRSAKRSSEGFLSLLEATTDARKHGFDPTIHYWTAATGGRTTHYRPGKAPVNVPSSQDPPA